MPRLVVLPRRGAENNSVPRLDIESTTVTFTFRHCPHWATTAPCEGISSMVKQIIKIKNIYFQKFIKSKTLRAHLKECRSNNMLSTKPYSCGQCKESFICESDLQIHSALHNKGNNWTCNKCLKEFTGTNM